MSGPHAKPPPGHRAAACAAVRSRAGWPEGAGWKATSIGAHHSAAENILKQDYSDDIVLSDAIKLVIKVTAARSTFDPGVEDISAEAGGRREHTVIGDAMVSLSVSVYLRPR